MGLVSRWCYSLLHGISFPTCPVGPSTDQRLGLELRNKHGKCEACVTSWSSSHDHHISGLWILSSIRREPKPSLERGGMDWLFLGHSLPRWGSGSLALSPVPAQGSAPTALCKWSLCRSAWSLTFFPCSKFYQNILEVITTVCGKLLVGRGPAMKPGS